MFKPQYQLHAHVRGTTYFNFRPPRPKGCSFFRKPTSRTDTYRQAPPKLDIGYLQCLRTAAVGSYGTVYKFNCIDKYTIFWVNALTTCVTNNNVRPRRRLLYTSAFEVQSSGLNKPQMIISQDVADMAFNYRSKRTE